MRYIFLVLMVCCAIPLHGQNRFNAKLKHRLDSVLALDQKYRETLSLLLDPAVAERVAEPYNMTPAQLVNKLWKMQNRLDSLNVIFVKGVIKRYGYPGKTLVGAETSTAAWFVIQHSKDIDHYLDVMKTAADKGELPFNKYAMMLDRHLMSENKEQIYGTQCACRPIKASKTPCFVWPVADAEHVNQRRKSAGFDTTVEQNATRLGVVYQVLTLADVLPPPPPWYKTFF